jgi:hypothetical protein
VSNFNYSIEDITPYLQEILLDFIEILLDFIEILLDFLKFHSSVSVYTD